MKSKRVKQKGSPLNKKDIQELFRDNEEIYAYKYARDSKDSYGNTTRFINHKEDKWIHDKFWSRYGLFFVVDEKYLLPYMNYGNILVRIKINKSDLKKMKIKKHVNIGICEYSCKKYYVDKIMKLDEWSTLEFIVNSADITFPANFAKGSIAWLKKIGVEKNIINKFQEKLLAKGIQ